MDSNIYDCMKQHKQKYFAKDLLFGLPCYINLCVPVYDCSTGHMSQNVQL